tara:strand:+ start:840 stop:1043 length:204 start_codon:yes stop_codon:yes gene_type:complete
MSKEDDKMLNVTDLVFECIATHNELILVELITRLEKEYVEIAELSTLGKYKSSWSHEDVLNYITYET